MPSPPDPTPGLTRWHAAALVAGSMVGVGIFLTPRLVAQAAGTGPLFFAVWAVGALVALAGALSVGELGTMLPQAGGDYVYLRAAYGDAVGFLYGWLSLLASFSGAIAAMAIGIPRYQGPLLLGPSDAWTQPLVGVAVGPWTWTLLPDQAVAIVLVWLLTLLACLRVRVAGRVQLTLTGAVMGTLLLGGLWALAHPTHAPAGPPLQVQPGPVLRAFTAVFFSYSGWNTAGYVAAELRRPARDLPWALLAATGAVGLLYLLLNAAFVTVLGDVGQAFEAGSASAVVLLGPAGGVAMALVIAVAVTGAMLASIVSGSRIYYALAQDGLFFASAGRLHAALRTPVRSLVVQALWITLLLATSTFDQLLRWSTLAMMALSVLTVAAVPVLRHRRPDLPRPFRAWGHPWTALAYALPCAAVLVASVADQPLDGVVAVAVCAVGALAWRVVRRAPAGDPIPP